jgi:hypothetical protein
MKAVQPVCPTANDDHMPKPRSQGVEQAREGHEIIHVRFLE